LSLDDLELHLIALLQAFVALGGNGTVMDEYIRSIFPAEEAISLGIVEPLDGAFQTFHVRLLFLADTPNKARFQGTARNVLGIVLLTGVTVKA
jgi:hypothetical protein